MFIQGTVITDVYPFRYQSENSIWTGIRYSLIIWLLVHTMTCFGMDAKFNISPISTNILRHTIFSIFTITIAGAILSLIFGPKNIKMEINNVSTDNHARSDQ